MLYIKNRIPIEGNFLGEDVRCMCAQGNEKNMQIIGSVQKSLQILKYMATLNEETSISDLVEAMGINKSTMHHYLATLGIEGFVLQNLENKKYRIGPAAFEVGECYLTKDFPYDDIKRVLQQLQREIGQNIYFFIRSGSKAICVLVKEETPYMTIGYNLPLYGSTVGKVFMANMAQLKKDKVLKENMNSKLTEQDIKERNLFNKELIEIRLRGYAVNNLEYGESRGLAVPVFGFGDEIVAVLSVVGISDDILADTSEERIDKWMGETINIVIKYGKTLSDMVHNVVL